MQLARLPLWGVLVLACLLPLAPAPQRSLGEDKPRQTPLVQWLDPNPLKAMSAFRTPAEARTRGMARAVVSGEQYHVLRVEFKDAAKCRAFSLKGATPLARFEKFATVLVKVDDARTLNALSGLIDTTDPATDSDRPIVWIEAGDTAVAPPPPPVRAVEEKPRGFERIARGGVGGLTGKGVIIAVVDSGIDFRSREFITDEGGKPSSRLLYLWDTLRPPPEGGPGKAGPLRYPNGAPIGTLYSRADLTAELRAGGKRIPEPDTVGHGTGCAAVAAGNGRHSGKDHVGAAPGADLIAVRVGSEKGVENAYLLGAICGWVEKVAGGRPFVVTCSFGGHKGGHDGFRIQERELTARFAASARGRALCIAAGNEGEDRLHARVEFAKKGDKTVLRWVPTSEEKPAAAVLTLFLDAGTERDILIEKPAEVRVLSGRRNRLSGSFEVALMVPAEGKLELSSKADRAVAVDAYLTAAEGHVGFHKDLETRSGLIGTPGMAEGALTVGSYDFNDEFPYRKGDSRRLPIEAGGKLEMLEPGALSAYSSPGYSRKGTLKKPDIVAPGQYHIVPAVTATPKGLRNAAGGLTFFNGTSAATPYTAGIVALMLEKNPRLTVGQIKELIHANATSGTSKVPDRHVGKAPNPEWGYGKLDRQAVERLIAAVPKP